MTTVVLLDLDGTLIDSKPGIAQSILDACRETGLDAPDAATLHSFVGPPLAYSLEQHYGIRDHEFAERFTAAYRRSYLDGGMANGVVYAGIPAALDALSERGERLFVATSKPRVHAETMLASYDLARHFDAIYGSELDGGLFDKADLIAHVLSREAVAPESAVMVGDRRFDIEGALANSVRAVGALWGYGGRRELDAAGAVEFCGEPSELPERVGTRSGAPSRRG